MLVMVADDDEDFRNAIVEALHGGGDSTVEARDGRELLPHEERERVTDQVGRCGSG